MPKPFTHTLALLRGGAFADECGEKFADVLKGVEETGKAGKLTITIDVKKAGGAVQVACKVTDKSPSDEPDADMFWTTPEGNLTVQNPNQRSLDLQPIAAPRRELANGG